MWVDKKTETLPYKTIIIRASVAKLIFALCLTLSEVLIWLRIFWGCCWVNKSIRCLLFNIGERLLLLPNTAFLCLAFVIMSVFFSDHVIMQCLQASAWNWPSDQCETSWSLWLYVRFVCYSVIHSKVRVSMGLHENDQGDSGSEKGVWLFLRAEEGNLFSSHHKLLFQPTFAI